MSGQPTTSAVSEEQAYTSKEDMSLEEKIGMAKKFDREMKDYAKATVKEFLGIYGYEEDVDINMDDSETQKASETSTNTSQTTDKQTESTITTTSTMASTCSVEKETGSNDRPVSSVSISSSTTNGNADMTRFCMTMSIPRPGAESLEGYTTLRFWNCIMCSTAFVGTKPEIIQRVNHPQLFTYQPEWLSHAGICNRCQKTLTMQAPKITIYAINETPQYHQGATPSVPVTSVPGIPSHGTSNSGGLVPGDEVQDPSIPRVPRTFVHGAYVTGTSVPVFMCNALPGQCDCAQGGHNLVPGVGHLAYQGVNVPVVTNTEAKTAYGETGYIANMTQYIPITCTQ